MIRPSNRASIRNISDYSPFGVQLSERTISGDGYRFGFQGQEGDSEVKGEGNSVNYKYRMHDPRLGRFFAVDPLAAKYTAWSPYTFVLNSPIIFVDIDGREVTLHGEDASPTLVELQKATSLTLTMDEKGKISAVIPEGGVSLSTLDNALLNAINDKDVNVNLYTTKAEWFKSKDGTGPYPLVVGGYEGSEMIDGKIETTQLFNLEMANKLEAEGIDKAGNAAAHEILESYYGGKDDPKGGYDTGYASAHKKAEDDDDYDPGTTMYQNKNSATGITDFGMAKGEKMVILGDSSTESKAKIFVKP